MIAELFEKVKDRYEGIFPRTESIALDAESVFGIVRELASYSILAAPELFAEGFVDLMAQRKPRVGQYSTPKNVSRFMVEMLRPRAHDTVIDPACGTGAFLFECMEYVRQYSPDASQEFANRLYGIDIVRDLVQAAKMNMVMRGGNYSNIFVADSLRELPDEIRIVMERGGFDVVIVDPPWGRRSKYVEGFNLSEKWRSHQSYVLFIERALQLARAHGRIGVIVPENLLFAENLRHVRAYLLDHAFVRAIVTLPDGAYLPMTTLRATALILEKREPGPTANYDVFMAGADPTDSLTDIAIEFNGGR